MKSQMSKASGPALGRVVLFCFGFKDKVSLLGSVAPVLGEALFEEPSLL